MPRTPNSASAVMFSNGKVPSIQRCARARNSLCANSRTVETKRRCSSLRLGNTGLSSSGRLVLARLGVGDEGATGHLLHQLAQHRFGEAVETFGHDDKRRRAADHIMAIVILEPGFLAEDRQAVD